MECVCAENVWIRPTYSPVPRRTGKWHAAHQDVPYATFCGIYEKAIFLAKGHPKTCIWGIQNGLSQHNRLQLTNHHARMQHVYNRLLIADCHQGIRISTNSEGGRMADSHHQRFARDPRRLENGDRMEQWRSQSHARIPDNDVTPSLKTSRKKEKEKKRLKKKKRE